MRRRIIRRMFRRAKDEIKIKRVRRMMFGRLNSQLMNLMKIYKGSPRMKIY